ncbi:MAG: nuclear transport factor 2 family protein [Candidatus Cloacimonetes bacterium]|nr:nuclear transport factor 2 family protein [Candidatus Cloacimonadota bacterium]
MRSILLFILTMFLLSACTQIPKELTEQQKTQIQSEVKKLTDELLADSQKLSTDAMQKYLNDKEGLTFKMGGVSFKKANLIEAVKKEYETYKEQTLTIKDEKSIILSDKSVLWVSEIESKAIDKSGKEGQMILHETWLWEKENGEWKATHFDEYWLQ